MDVTSGNVARVLKAASGLESIRRAELRYRLNGDEARACPQLSQIRLAAKWMVARKLRAVLS